MQGGKKFPKEINANRWEMEERRKRGEGVQQRRGMVQMRQMRREYSRDQGRKRGWRTSEKRDERYEGVQKRREMEERRKRGEGVQQRRGMVQRRQMRREYSREGWKRSGRGGERGVRGEGSTAGTRDGTEEANEEGIQ